MGGTVDLRGRDPGVTHQNGHPTDEEHAQAEALLRLHEAFEYLRMVVLNNHDFAYGWYGHVAKACYNAIRSTPFDGSLKDPARVPTEALRQHAIEVSEKAALDFMVELFGNGVKDILAEEEDHA